jgi:hypothetical protein
MASAASTAGAKLIAVTKSANTSDDTAKALDATLPGNFIHELY